MTARVFGLTGGIGSGKSTVARCFRERGLPVIDADVLAREVVAKGSDGLREITAAFGQDVLDPNGELDRKALAARVFGDEAARQTLNRITHPRVGQLSIERFSELSDGGEPLVCYEVPLLFEGRLADGLRPVVVVSVDAATQLARTMGRDDCTAAEAQARIDAQMPLAEKVERADIVIDNQGSPEAIVAHADAALAAVCELAGVDPGRYGLG